MNIVLCIVVDGMMMEGETPLNMDSTVHSGWDDDVVTSQIISLEGGEVIKAVSENFDDMHWAIPNKSTPRDGGKNPLDY